jgi:hypothetical protein
MGIVDSETCYPVENMTLPWVTLELSEYETADESSLTNFDRGRIRELKAKQRILQLLKS